MTFYQLFFPKWNPQGILWELLGNPIGLDLLLQRNFFLRSWQILHTWVLKGISLLPKGIPTGAFIKNSHPSNWHVPPPSSPHFNVDGEVLFKGVESLAEKTPIFLRSCLLHNLRNIEMRGQGVEAASSSLWTWEFFVKTPESRYITFIIKLPTWTSHFAVI